MQSELANNTSLDKNQDFFDAEANRLLNEIISLGYESVSSDTFIQEILGEDTEEVKQIARDLNEHIRGVSMDEYRKIAAPLMMQVVAVNDDNTISVNKPTDRNGDDCWTHIYNPTIFNHLSVGDEVLIGYYEGGQKSNCWVMFAKTNDLENKTILKDIKDINNKIDEYNNKIKKLELEMSTIKETIKDYHNNNEG